MLLTCRQRRGSGQLEGTRISYLLNFFPILQLVGEPVSLDVVLLFYHSITGKDLNLLV